MPKNLKAGLCPRFQFFVVSKMNSLISPKCVFYAVVACTIGFVAHQSSGQVKIVPYDGKQQQPDKAFIPELPPIITESAADIEKILAPRSLPKISRQAPGTPEILVTRQGNPVTAESTPAIKPWNSNKLEELPPVKSWQKGSLEKASWEKNAPVISSFTNPQKPLPVIHRSDSKSIIDTADQMMIEISKSNLKADQPILYTQQAAGFGQPAAYDQRSQSQSSEAGNASQVPIYPNQSATRPYQSSTRPTQRSWAPHPAEAQSNADWSSPSQGQTTGNRVPPAKLKNQIESLLNHSRNADSRQVVATEKSHAANSTAADFAGAKPATTARGGAESREVSNPYVPQVKFAKQSRAAVSGRLPQIKPISSPQDVMPETSVVQQDVLQGTELMAVDNYVEMGMGQATFPSTPLAVLRGEALFLARERGETGISNAFRLDPFDHELGIRLHAERLFGVAGRSLTYSGLQEWNDVQRLAAGGGLGINPVSGGLPAGTLTPFANAIFQQHFHRSNMHTVELNNVTWGWDVLNLFWGLRFTHYEEELSFFSARADGQQGLLDLDLENNMFGPQVGAEVFYDIGTRFSTGFKGKIGVMANAFEGQTLLISNGTRQINNADTEVELNFMAEMGIFARMRLGPRAYLRGGYELWYNSAVFGANDNVPAVITPAFGTASNDGDLFVHGATAGFEFIW